MAFTDMAMKTTLVNRLYWLSPLLGTLMSLFFQFLVMAIVEWSKGEIGEHGTWTTMLLFSDVLLSYGVLMMILTYFAMLIFDKVPNLYFGWGLMTLLWLPFLYLFIIFHRAVTFEVYQICYLFVIQIIYFAPIIALGIQRIKNMTEPNQKHNGNNLIMIAVTSLLLFNVTACTRTADKKQKEEPLYPEYLSVEGGVWDRDEDGSLRYPKDAEKRRIINEASQRITFYWYNAPDSTIAIDKTAEQLNVSQELFDMTEKLRLHYNELVKSGIIEHPMRIVNGDPVNGHEYEGFHTY